MKKVLFWLYAFLIILDGIFIIKKLISGKMNTFDDFRNRGRI
jgi:uncharacterized protein YxeA